MRRIALLTFLLLAVLPAAGASAARSPLTLRLATCHQGTNTAASYYLDANTTVRLVPRSRTLALRFDLLGRKPGQGHFSAVSNPDLGRFSARYRHGFAPFAKRIEGLAPGATYKLRVTVRWYTKGGRVLRTASRTTRPCVEADRRPDLHIARVQVKPSPTGAGQRYVATLVNRGGSEARDFQVALQLADGTVVRQRTIRRLRAGATTVLRVDGPTCSTANAPRIVVDGQNTVSERDEADSVVPVACPSG